MKLSHRLELVASFVPQGSRVADVGTDHGFIPIKLIESGIASGVIALDVREGPLKRAQEHIEERGLGEKIQTRLGDGLKPLKNGEADTVVIAGLGGELMIHILEEGSFLWNQIAHWVLSPQSGWEKVRRYLDQNGFAIRQETMIEEDGKYYLVLLAGRGSMNDRNDLYYRYGKTMIEQRHPVLLRYLEREQKKLTQISDRLRIQDSDISKRRLIEIERELSWIQEAWNEM